MMRKISILIVFLFSIFQAFGQDRNITGTVVDETGTGMPGATVQVKGTTKGTVTDVNGAYAIAAPAGSALQFSYVGYTMQEVAVGETNVINVNLAPEAKNLDEVVVVGYGVQKKSLVTGAIAKVKTEDIVSQPSLRVEQALQGRTSGVVFNQTSGQPGAQITVRIRGVSSNGNSDPLYIVDGMKSSKYVMNELSPSDIESVEVLKDAASAAIYGSEGANGVIIITTKTGGKKDRTTIQYDAYYGVQVPDYVNPMSADQYRTYMREAYAYDQLSANSTALVGFTLPSFITEKPKFFQSAEDSLLFIKNDPQYQYSKVQPVVEPILNNAKTQQQAIVAANQAIVSDPASTAAQIKAANKAITAANTNIKAVDDKLDILSTLNQNFDYYSKNALKASFADGNGNLTKNGIFGKSIDETSKGTNWMDEIFQNAAMQSHHLSVQTSTEKSNLYMAGSYFSQDGVVGGSANNFSRYNFRVNADHQAKDWLKIGTNITLAQTKSHNIATNDAYAGIVASAMSYDPTLPVYWNDTSEFMSKIPFFKGREDSMIQSSDGKYYTVSTITEGERINPMARMEIRKAVENTTERALGNFYAELKPIKSLTFRTAYSGELTYTTDDDWQKAWYMTETKNERGYLNKNINRYFTYQIDNTLTFAHIFGDHDITALAGQSYSKYNHYNVYAQRVDPQIFTEDFLYLDQVPVVTVVPTAATVDKDWKKDNSHRQGTGGTLEGNAKLSYFGRLNYNYKEKYLLSATFRRDGSSLFAPGHQYGNFPSASIGWNVNKEDFFNVPSISMLKLRASWGTNGSLSNVGSYQWVTNSSYQVINGQIVIQNGSAKNPDLTWETSKQTNIGADFGFFKNKLTVSVEYYNKTTTDLLAVPYTNKWVGGTGSGSWANVGEVQNKGFEFDLGYAERESEFKYDVKYTASYLKNEVTKFILPLEGYNSPGGKKVTYFEEGYPVWYFKGYKATGVFQSYDEIRNYTYTDPTTGVKKMIQPDAIPGDAKIEDVGGAYDKAGNPIGDGKITTSDITEVGKPMPTWTMGFNFNCDFKGFDFGMFWYSEIDKTIFNATLRERGMYNREEYWYNDRWTAGSGVNDFPRATYNVNGDAYNIGGNSFWFEDGSYLRLKNVTLGYTLPQSLTQKIAISKFRIYFTATNLLTITNYKGSDPEVGETSGSNSYGVDLGMYPSSKTFIGGINVTF